MAGLPIKNQPLISVLVPVYNVEKYLRQCLDSVISQTLKDIEIICVNDGSTDSSLQILQEYVEKDNRIRIINKEKNEGLVLARKSAVLQSTGKYICFLDSDDWLTTDESLQIMVDAIEIEQVDMLMFPVEFSTASDIEIVDYERRFNHGSKHLEGATTIIRYWYDTFFWYIWPKVYRAEVCKKAFAEIENRYFVMWDDVYGTFMLSYFTDTFKSINTKPLITYRLGTGISTKKQLAIQDFNQFTNAFEMLECLERFLRKEGRYDDYREILDGVFIRFVKGIFNALHKLRTEDLSKAFDKLIQYCDVTNLLKKSSETKYCKYKILSKITFGKTRKRYARKVREQWMMRLLLNHALQTGSDS